MRYKERGVNLEDLLEVGGKRVQNAMGSIT